MLGIFVAWVALWWVSRIMEYAPHASLWYPPAALSYVVFRQYGYQGIPAIVLAVVAVTLVSANLDQQALPNHLVLLTGLLYACAHAAPYYLAARIMAKQRPANTGRAAPRVAIAFLIISSLASLLAAVLGAMSLVLAGVIGENEALAIVLPWWIGDFAAILALGPAGVFWLNRVAIQRQTSRQIPRDQYYYQADQKRPSFLIKLAVCFVIIAVSALLASVFPSHQAPAFLIFFVIIPQMWIVYSEGVMPAVISVAINSTALALVISLFALNEYALSYQFAMIIIASSAYFGMAVPMLFADNAELRHLVITDSLTGAATRHHFQSECSAELNRAKRYEESVSLITIDIDQFKNINDIYGHTQGDIALANVVRVCRSVIRGTDLLGRVGGDEFIVLLPMTPLVKARETAERLRLAIFNSSIMGIGKDVSISASLGVAEIDVKHESWEQAFERADRALFQAKRAGRNQVVVA